MQKQQILYYVHDPMCSWCYAFRPLWITIKQSLPTELTVRYLVGGLAPDNNEVMPQALQEKLQATWQHISQAVPGTRFNHDFWTKQTARRSTYPACRAVLAAKAQNAEKEEAMIAGIQQAYYQQAKNPSDNDTLIQIATEMGLNREQFAADLLSKHIEQTLTDEIQFTRSIGGNSFPSLFLFDGKNYQPIQLSYTDKSVILSQLIH